jgi:hypothetical protein
VVQEEEEEEEEESLLDLKMFPRFLRLRMVEDFCRVETSVAEWARD